VTRGRPFGGGAEWGESLLVPCVQTIVWPGWFADSVGGFIHVHPVDDLRPHEVDTPCWRHPTEDEGVMVHHSLDNREDWEKGRRRLS